MDHRVIWLGLLIFIALKRELLNKVRQICTLYLTSPFRVIFNLTKRLSLASNKIRKFMTDRFAVRFTSKAPTKVSFNNRLQFINLTSAFSHEAKNLEAS